MNEDYVNDLENFVRRMLKPMRDLSFRVIIKSISGQSVLTFKKEQSLIKTLGECFEEAGDKINARGIKSNRANEVGNKIEPFVKNALINHDLEADTPQNRDGRRISAGYPDMIFYYKKKPVYLECKTYNLDNINTTQRSFYFSPSKNFKITQDAPHLLVSYQILKKSGRYFTSHWRLYSLENLKVDLKHEFNQSNRKLYGNSSYLNLIEEGDIK